MTYARNKLLLVIRNTILIEDEHGVGLQHKVLSQGPINHG